MTLVIIIGAVVVLAALAVAGVFVWRKRRAVQLDADYFLPKWQDLQKLLRDKAQWSEAILEADRLLDEALKKKHVKGRSMGERLVKAQRDFTDNDALWFAHKLRTKIDTDPTTKLKERDVKQALLGFRQALKDLGALS